MMYTEKDVKTACNRLLSQTFPDIPVYGTDTLDGYKRPSFFTELVSRGRSRTSRYLAEFGYRYRITYFERTHDEAHCLDVFRKVSEAFEPAVRLGNKRRNCLFVEDIDFQFVDEHADKLQISVDFYRSIELGGYVPEGGTAGALGLRSFLRTATGEEVEIGKHTEETEE